MSHELNGPDREALRFLSEQRVAVSDQLAALLGVRAATADRRLRRLAERGLIARERIFEGLPVTVSITRNGLRAIDSPLATPSLDLKGYRHDIGVGWLWLAAHSGSFGKTARVVSEREMRSVDARLGRAGRQSDHTPYGVGIGGIGPTGLPQRHYPDLLLQLESSRTVAVELELTRKSARRLAGIMRGYACDPRIDAVLYIVPDVRGGQMVRAAARRAGIADLVHIQLLADEGSIQGTRSWSAQRRRVQAAVRSRRDTGARDPGEHRSGAVRSDRSPSGGRRSSGRER